MTDNKTHWEAVAQQDAVPLKVIAEKQPKVLIIGVGQIGIELVAELLKSNPLLGGISAIRPENLILADIPTATDRLKKMGFPAGVRIKEIDVTSVESIKAITDEEKPDIVFELAAVLSSQMEEQGPSIGYRINYGGAVNTMSALAGSDKEPVLFIPSSIAGAGCKPENRNGHAAQDGVFLDNGPYGNTKVMVEAAMATIARDVSKVRSTGVRWPAISSASKNLVDGGGTTGYTVDIFRSALRGDVYECPIDANLALPMMTGSDAVRSMIYAVARASQVELKDMKTEMPHAHHYNMPAVSMTPKQLHAAMLRCLPAELQANAQISYQLDEKKNGIASGWYAESEGSAFKHDCFGFGLANDTPERFAAHLLASFARQPELLHNEGDSPARTAQIENNCRAVLEHLSTHFGVNIGRELD